MKFRKKPVVVEAIRWSGLNNVEIMRWQMEVAPKRLLEFHSFTAQIGIPTLEGTMMANVGDWIICGVAQELYPCRDDIFRATYEEE